VSACRSARDCSCLAGPKCTTARRVHHTACTPPAPPPPPPPPHIHTTQTDNDIRSLPIPQLQRGGGFLFVWVINSKVQYTLDLFEQWGYT
jgi:hypothetical protein